MDISSWITAVVSIMALGISLCTLLITRNQRRPYLSLSFDVQEKSLCLTNYGNVPAKLNEIDFQDDLDMIKATDQLAATLFDKDPGKPFEDLEGTVVGPGLSFFFCIDVNAKPVKANPFITATLRYAAANRPSVRESPYKESFTINLRPRRGYQTALYCHKRQTD